MRTKFRLLGVGLAGLLCTCATATPPAGVSAPPPPRPALWLVADEDTQIYLFGTIHLLPKDTQWRTAALDRALTEADELVVEVVLPEDQTKVAQVLMQLGTSPNLPPLVERVPAEKREALQALIASSGYPAEMFDRMESWAAAITLTSISLLKMGFDPSLGVEKELTKTYKEARKPMTGLETAEQQFGFFDHLSEEAQRTFLSSVADDPAGARAEFEAMLKSWLLGDVDSIADSFDRETALSAELREVLMHKRNAVWAEWVAKRLDRPGTVFIAVGAGHLAGEDSVQQLLEAKGLRSSRVQ